MGFTSPRDQLRRELVAAAHRIAETPRAYPVVPRYAHLGVRRRVHGAYLIFYRIDPDAVLVLHILHGARDDVLLFP